MTLREQPLRIGKAGGRIRDVAMRWTASHQQGVELVFDDLRGRFEASSVFEALALYRATIEPEGWRLLHAAARADCWPDPRTNGYRVQCLTLGVDETVAIECFAPAAWDEVTDLCSQRAYFDGWMASLAPVPVGRVRPRAGHEHDPPGVAFSGIAVTAGEYLVHGKPNVERILAWAREGRARA